MIPYIYYNIKAAENPVCSISTLRQVANECTCRYESRALTGNLSQCLIFCSLSDSHNSKFVYEEELKS